MPTQLWAPRLRTTALWSSLHRAARCYLARRPSRLLACNSCRMRTDGCGRLCLTRRSLYVRTQLNVRARVCCVYVPPPDACPRAVEEQNSIFERAKDHFEKLKKVAEDFAAWAIQRCDLASDHMTASAMRAAARGVGVQVTRTPDRLFVIGAADDLSGSFEQQLTIGYKPDSSQYNSSA